MKTTGIGIARQLGARRVLQLVFFLPKFLKLFLRLFNDSRVTLAAKLVPLGVLCYLILPMDLVPDVFPIFGQIDDLVVIFLGMRLFLRLCPPAVVRAHVEAIAEGR